MKESEADTIARRLGWTILKDGWPDRLYIKPDGSSIVVEIKDGQDYVRENQNEMHRALKALGVQVKVATKPKDLYTSDELKEARIIDREAEKMKQFKERQRKLSVEREQLFRQRGT